VCNEIEHDHTLHESLHHNEHHQHPSPRRHPSFRARLRTVNISGIYKMQEIYQVVNPRGYGTYGSPRVLGCAVLYRIVWSETAPWTGPPNPQGPCGPVDFNCQAIPAASWSGSVVTSPP
jgi:hypothetical protein